MEDKTFELLTKMYSDFSKRFDDMGNRLELLETGQKKTDTLIENGVKNDIKALYDGYNQTYDKLIEIEKKVDNISVKVEKQDVEIRVIKGGAAKA